MSNILIIIALMITVPWILWKIFRLETWIPLPMFQVVLGIALGPSITGQYFPELWNLFFTDQVKTGLNAIQMIAISIFAFIAGSELKIGEVVKDQGHGIWLQGLKVIAVPIFIASVCFWFLFDSSAWHGDRTTLWQFSWCMGVATCITAMPMLVVALKQLGLWQTSLSRKLLLLVTFDDLVLWMTVLFVISLGTYLTKSLVFFLVFTLLWYVWPRFLEKTESGSWPVLTVSLAFALGFFSDWAGLHYVLGAFLAGMISPRFSLAWNKEMETIQMYWLMPVFFIWTGLRTNWSTDWALIIGAALIMYLISLVTKFIGVWLAYRKLGMTEVLFKTSLLQNKGLMEILLGTVMLGANIISSNMFAAIVVMSVLSTVTSVPLARLFYQPEANKE